MESVHSSFTTPDGTQVFAQYWKPEAPRAVLVTVHGLGEHSGRYAHVARFFAQQGIALYAYDHRGHGRTTGKRGHIPHYESLMEEVDLAVAEAAQTFPGLPQFLYGHSWGGNIVLNHLIRRQPRLKGAIATGPWLHIPKVPALQEKMARLVNRIFPSLTQGNGLDIHHLSRDKAVVEAYKKDPLVHSKISVRLFVDCDAAAKYALAHAGKVSVPLLLMHGGKDLITLPSGSIAFQKGLQGTHQFKLWDELMHEIHNEPEQMEVFGTMLRFLEAAL